MALSQRMRDVDIQLPPFKPAYADAGPCEGCCATLTPVFEKAKIASSLGELKLALSGLTNEALASNDRAKNLVTLLLLATGHAGKHDADMSRG